MSLKQANRDVHKWCKEEAGMRIHGTTKEQPRRQYEDVEKKHLKPLPETAYDLAIWKKAKLHRDCHIVLEGSYYSAPFRMVGQSLWVCAGTRQVRLFNEKYELVATHERASKPGTRQTHRDHYPPEKLPGLERTRESCLELAATLGSAVRQTVEQILADPVLDRIHQAGRLLRLNEKYGNQRLNDACQRALNYADPAYKTVKGILKQNLDQEAQPIPVQIPAARTFSRQPEELVGTLAEVPTWS